MRIGLRPVMLLTGFVLPVFAQERDSVEMNLRLENIVIVGESRQKMINRASALAVEVVDKKFLQQHFTGNLIQTLEHLPGVSSMDIGSAFSKPMIRGMGFNRISVTENGIKQEGQQWGADHGLETDAFNAEQITVRKGPASLLYGSDAMGGAIEIAQLPPPPDNQLFGEVVALGTSVNETLGGSAMLGVRKDAWYVKLRYSEQHFADYRIPADTLVYLTQQMPVYGRRLKNTAGFERDVSLYTRYHQGGYRSVYALSNVFQQVGFFPGAHGIPDVSRLRDDGDRRNIDLPYNWVNHLKVSSRQEYVLDGAMASWDLGYQHNYREELSLFHTHYGDQTAPAENPDKELAFSLHTYSSSAKLRLFHSSVWEHTAGWDMQYQQNRIGGYSFLMPAYKRMTTGVLWLTTYRPNTVFSLSGGIRYDYGKMDSEAYSDPYLENYLRERGHSGERIEAYRWRSYPVNRSFDDVSGSIGFVWTPDGMNQLKSNIGRSFRLPGANELASNGVHHGAFRHEQGDPGLPSEQGWQWDLSYVGEREGISLSVSPFVSWFENYIYLRPTGEWSALPHAGQIYRYTGAEAVFAGGEASFAVDFLQFNYSLTAGYVYTYNVDERIPLSFSPPAQIRNTLSWTGGHMQAYAELQSIAAQHRIARNESPTPGAQLMHLGASLSLAVGGTKAEVSLSVRNLLNTAYYNHLSFYRKIEIPEPGRNFRLVIKIPFKSNLK
ncbi:MAG: TonB-dependent receptor [Tannerellaceae bacterium]|jgi:iron complex outermembrane receptor protein|nr:TonB-dependent receptor [Tannerellaceae bacterium]